jgi:hypothetical protein
VNDRAQPRASYRDGVVPTTPEFGFHLPQLRLQPLPHRLPKHREASAPLLPANVREAKEVERIRLPEPTLVPAFGGICAEFQ